MRKCVWMAGCLAVLAAAALGEAQKVSLKIGYEPGTYVMTTTTDMNNVTTMSTGQTMDQKMKMTMVVEIDAGQKDPQGTQKLRMTFKRVAQSITGGPMSMTYDSAEPEGGNPMLAMTYRAILDKPIEVTIDKEGKAVAVSGMDEMWDAMATENPAMAQTANAMKEQLGNNYMAQMVDMGYRMMPSAPVGMGETWESDHQLELPMIGKADVKQKSTLKELKDSPAGQVAVIAFTSTIEKPQAEGVESGGTMQVTVDKAKITQTGTTEMAVASGMLLNYAADQKASMSLSMHPGDMPEGQPGAQPVNMAMEQDGKVQMTVQKGKYVPPAPKPTGESQPAPAQPAAPRDSGL